jgi:serine/threonine-protein kinase
MDEASPGIANSGLNSGDKLILSDCCQRYVGTERLFCLDCGKPLHPLGTIGVYHVVKVLERDRLGITQLVWQDGQTLMLRTLNPEWASHPEALEMFEQEAEQLLKVNHPMLPRFLDVFVAGEQPYLVMQPLYGQSLQQVVATRGTVSLQQAIAWVLQACHALEYLHQQTPPLIHQDIRPENLLRRASINSDIALVGLYPCRSLKMAIQPDFAGYSAPEQQQGQAFTTSDLYALAPTLVYLLTGKLPSTFYTQREQGYRFYPEYVPGLEAELVPILRKLTNPAPEERYNSIGELVEALQELVPIGV